MVFLEPWCQSHTEMRALQWLCVKMSHSRVMVVCASKPIQSVCSCHSNWTDSLLIHAQSTSVLQSVSHNYRRKDQKKKINDVNNDVTFNKTCTSGWERLACKKIIAAKLQHNVCFHKCCQQGNQVKGGVCDNICADSIQLPWHLLKSILLFQSNSEHYRVFI